MKKSKKLVSMSLISIMLILSACGNTNTEVDEEKSSSSEKSSEQTSQQTEAEETTGITFPLEEPMTFDLNITYTVDADKWSDNHVMDYIIEKTNVHFNFTELASTEAVEKNNLMFTGGDYQEVYMRPSMSYDTLAQEGIVIPLEDLIREYAPNLVALLDKYDAWSEITAPDGHIYGLPTIGAPGTAVNSSVLWYNKTWMEKVGMKEPTNMDELTELLRAFKENDVNGNGDSDDEIPLHLNTSQSWANMQAFMTDGLHWYNNYMALMEEGEYADRMVYYLRTEEFKENLLKYLIQWYQEGLIDKNCFTQDYATSTDIGQTNNIYGMFWNTLSFQAAPTENIAEYYSLTPFEKGYFPCQGVIVNPYSIVITDKCENPEILVAWADFLYTEEGGNLSFMGVEGVDYVINEETGGYTSTEGFRRLHGNNTGPGYMTDLSRNKDRGEATYQNHELYIKTMENGRILPIITNTQEEKDRISDLSGNINAYASNYIAELMIGEQSLDDTWEDFKATLIKMGVEEMEELYQAGYDKANAE